MSKTVPNLHAVTSIPATFRLFALEYTVKFSPDIHKDQNALGLIHFDANEILVQTPSDQHSIQVIQQAFYHELTHALLSKCQQTDLPDLHYNEIFVDAFSHLLHQFMVTKAE